MSTLTALKTGKRFTLGKPIASGGEGTVYHLQNNALVVAKLYHAAARTQERRIKLERLLSKQISIKEMVRLRIALPLDILQDAHGLFAGFVMPRLDALPLRVALFSKQRCARYFPNMERVELTNFAIGFVKQLQFLHRKGIYVGDINPLNVLIERQNPSHGWLIDADSFQVDSLPCPVGTDLFTPPRLQGCDFKQTLRCAEDEAFSMAIMLFMILMMGKHPYAKIGGESPAKNIAKMDFPYPLHGGMAEVPKGEWGYIWTHFNRELKSAFVDVFTGKRHYSDTNWLKLLEKYRHVVSKGYFSKKLYPEGYRATDPVYARCGKCGKLFSVERRWKTRLEAQGKAVHCARCQQRVQAEILARKSNSRQVTPKYTAKQERSSYFLL